MSEQNLMEKLVSLCKRRGFIFQSSEIYGGINSCYDYGPLGVELKRNIKEAWWNAMVTSRDDIEGLDAAILMHPRVWEASGHVEGFTDPLVDCKKCKRRFRADHIEGDRCPVCGGELTEVRKFNLMFKTYMGPVEEEAAIVYLRPETAQGIYVNFLNVQMASRQKIPFGIAQIGKAFRNEITPGNFIFRTREFEQMEMQFFVKPGTDKEWFEYWKEQRLQWYDRIGIRRSKLRLHQHGPDELAHYASAAYDIEYDFPFGWQELEGIHNRTDFDLKRHMEYSGKDMRYFDQEEGQKYIPYIIETSAGCDRTLLTVLVDAYEEEQLEKDTRVVLHLSPRLAPIKAGIFPLVKRDGMPELAQKIKEQLQGKYRVFYDESGAIGRRYRRMDEAGTPFGITVDSQTLDDETVTIRERDSMQQTRVHISKIEEFMEDKMRTWRRE
ncbi:MAG: glycine--tRNA ligase [candidate division KSB1 bacterium]|nr:glycine--tRNA ligase [candidate division KSB1 bacterium]